MRAHEAESQEEMCPWASFSDCQVGLFPLEETLPRFPPKAFPRSIISGIKMTTCGEKRKMELVSSTWT